ncbi:MAG TPA: hypothetical protein PLQ68_11110 [Clostridia bacterium]|nr:hypothetical protein [Clostridia bacterium]
MKKLLVVLIALCAATAVFAEDAAKFNFNANGFAVATNYAGVEKDSGGDFGEARFQPLFNLTTGSFDFVLKLRIDTEFGANDDSANNDDFGSSSQFSSGTKQKAIKVLNAYGKSKVDAMEGLSLAAGVMSYDYPLVYSDNMPMFTAAYELNPITLNLYYGKLSEGDIDKGKDDSQVYIADAVIKFGESSIRPAFFYHQVRVNSYDNTTSNLQDLLGTTDPIKGSGYIYAINASIVAGQFGIDATGVYESAKYKDTATSEDVKIGAYAVDVAPYIKVGEAVKLTAFMTMVSGWDGSGSKDKSFLDGSLDPSSGLNTLRLYIIEDCGTFGSNSAFTGGSNMRYSDNSGYSAYGLAFDGSFGPVTMKVQGAYAKAAKVASGVKKDLGIEADVNIGYALTKVSTIFVEGAYLKTGKYFENGGSVDTQNVNYIAAGMTFSI